MNNQSESNEVRHIQGVRSTQDTREFTKQSERGRQAEQTHTKRRGRRFSAGAGAPSRNVDGMDHLIESGRGHGWLCRASSWLLDDRKSWTLQHRTVQRFCEGAGIDLRPHIKTHKSSVVARRQLDAGAVGVTVATLSEAIALGEAGVHTDVFLSTPVYYDGPKSRLLERAVRRCTSRSRWRWTATRSWGHWSTSRTGHRHGRAGFRTGSDRDDVRGPSSWLKLQEIEFEGSSPMGATDMPTRRGGGNRPDGGSCRRRRAAGGDMVLSAGVDTDRAFLGSSPVTEERPGTYVYGDRQQVALAPWSRRRWQRRS